MKRRWYALVDCNNFFVSCERVFVPSYEKRPVVVLSNNDGCIIARSDEAKGLGIKMGVPFYQVKTLCVRNNVKVLSCNFELYGNLSDRVMRTLEMYTPEIEIYSIDEAFLDVSHITQSKLLEFGCMIQQQILKLLGIPVSVGIATSKTLAKVAANIAKKNNGVHVLQLQSQIDAVLKATDLKDIWGFGEKSAIKLKMIGIGDAYELVNSNSRRVRNALTVTGLKKQLELRGIDCIKLDVDEALEPKKQIISSRSFGKSVSKLEELEEAVATYVSRAAIKLRKQNSVASVLGVYIKTSKYRSADLQYSKYRYINLPRPTCLTNELILHAKLILKQIYKSGLNYSKAGIVLHNISNADEGIQQSLLTENISQKQRNLMAATDKINLRYGKRCVFWAATGISQKWQMKRESKSPNYTGRVNELPTVIAN